MSLAAFGVQRPVVATIIKFVLLFGGVAFGLGLRREFFPETNPTQVMIAAPYPGASPDEIESSLATKIEDRVADLRDIKELTTTVSEGAAVVRIEFKEGVDIDVKVADVKREIDALQDLPERSERIIVSKFEPNIPVIILSLVGDAGERALKDGLRQIRDDLRSLPGMGDITLGGTRRDELIVEPRMEALLQHGLSLPQIADRIRTAMAELPGGSVKSPTGTIAIRTLGAEERAQAVRDVIIKADANGRVLRLGEIADVRDGFADTDVMVRLNGKPAVNMTVFKVGKQDAVVMSDMVKAYSAARNGEPFTPNTRERLAKLAGAGRDGQPISDRHRAWLLGASRAAELPGEIVLTTDLARFITGRLELLSRNALIGAIGVFITLFLLLNWRAAFWVLIGLAVSILGTLMFMRITDTTLNLLSMFGLIIVLGMLVDDGIVVAENIITRHDDGEPALSAAVHGTNEVTWPVIGTVTTTIFAFTPLLLIGGRMGDLLGALPIVVAIALAVSLIEALFCLPTHMAHSLHKADTRRQSRGQSRIERFESGFDHWRDGVFNRHMAQPFGRLLGWCLHRPWRVLAGIVAVFIVSLGVVAGGRLPFVFFGGSDAETIIGNLRMPIGTPIERTDEIIRRLESAALAQPEVQHVFAVSGAAGDIEGGTDAVQSHLGQVFIELLAVEVRQARGMRTSDDVTVSIREAAGLLPGIKSLRMEPIAAGPSGPPISLMLTGERAEIIAAAAERVKAVLADFQGVYDVADDSDRGQRELRLALRPGANELGFTTESVARQVRAAVFGLEAHTFAGNREDVDVRVRLPESHRRSLASIESMHVFSPAGRAVPLAEVVEITEASGYATVRRFNRLRAVTVTAEVNTSQANVESVMAAMGPTLREIEREFLGVRIVPRGRQQDMADSFATLPIGMAVALGLNFVVLAVLTGSYVQPLLIMVSIPLAIIGMIWGHIILGYDLAMLSLIGFVALSGVVVNNAIVYMDFFNRGIAAGKSVVEAARDAGVRRFRPILLTTITTTAGIGPMILEDSFQARVLIPMAITIVAGLIGSTVLVLIGLPCLLAATDQTRRAMRMVWTGRRISPEVPAIGGAPTTVASPNPTD